MGLSGFNARDYDTEQRPQYADLPVGTYRFDISQADWHQKDGETGKKGIKMAYDVLEPEELKGRKLFDYIVFENPSADAQRIGHEKLAKLCRATEFEPEEEPSEMLYKSFVATIGLGKPGKDKNADGTPVFPAKMEIKVFHYPDAGEMPEIGVVAAPVAANDNRPAANTNTRTTTTAPVETKPAGARPWSKKAS